MNDTGTEMHVGQVVVETTTGTRGVVIAGPFREGDRVDVGRWGPVPVGGVIIHLSGGHWRITDRLDRWQPVPHAEQTAYERVRSAAHTWVPSDWHADNPQDIDTLPFALLRALLPPRVADRLDDHGGIHTVEELAFEVARHIDEGSGDGRRPRERQPPRTAAP